MNVGVFNQVNYKERMGSMGMYSEWSSLVLEGGGRGVLGSLGGAGGRDVVLAVVKQLTQPDPSPLSTDAEVEWVLEVIRYGLSLPLCEHEALRDCVRVCCAWLSILLPPAPPAHPPPPPVPPPVVAAPATYARRILKHLHNLFVPRPGESGDLISKQAVLCHRVLRLARSLAGSAELGPREWKALLLLLLSAASALLCPPATPHSSADQLCERVLCVLFEVWILACHRCFPSPALWRTLREQCLRWRHRPALVEQWARVSLCLTARLLRHTYGPLYPAMPISDEDANLIPTDMSAEAVVQSWYRILHTIGNPVDLCRPHIISQTPDFLQFAITQEEGNRDPSQHPCLQALPGIFHKAMKGLAAHVDAFLGVSQGGWWEEVCGGGAGAPLDPPTPPAHRRLAKSFSVSSSHTVAAKTERLNKQGASVDNKGLPKASLIGLTGSRPSSVATTPPNTVPIESETERPPLAPMRPKVNSILHLFGEWLFEAALIGTVPQPQQQQNTQQRNDGTPPSSLSDVPLKVQAQSYQAGRAEALGALCRVLCSKQCGESVQAAYLARCYVAIQRGLRDPAVAAAVVLNSCHLFRLDLDGVLVLVADMIWALERVLPERTPRLEGAGDTRDLRRAAISLLLSLVALPHHLRGLPVPELPGSNECKGMTFGDLAGRISMLTVGAVQVEWSPGLAAPLLSALYLCVRHTPLDPTAMQYNLPSNASSHNNSVRSDSGSTAGSNDGSATPSSTDDYHTDATLRDLDPTAPGFGSALVVRATYLVCHRLISSWKGDLQVSLAALELLAGLARLHSPRAECVERKRAVRWICDYIALQCGRPPQAHSRDLHSCVVAAYQCLAAWLCPALLSDAACLATLMELVELGISGSKSVGKPGEPPKMKDEKELKPVSMRVRDAAESLLMLILEQTGTSGEGRLDERALGATSARHFLADDSLLLSLIEEPLVNNQEPHPTITAIVRGPFGRHAWSLALRGAARSAGAARGSAAARPIDMQEARAQPAPACAPLAHGPACAVDAAFPSLEAVLRQLGDNDAPQLFRLLDKQAAIEKEIKENQENLTPDECVPPEAVTEFQTARLFLSHFGYLNISGEKKVPRLVALDGNAPGLARALRRVDAAGARAALTVHLFCVRASQRTAYEILANTRRATTVSPRFLDMLRGLGWPVKVRGHAGWTGHADTSYDAVPDERDAENPSKTVVNQDDHGGGLYCGKEEVLYWADETSEIAFVVPTDMEEEAEEEQNVPKVDGEGSDVDGSCLSAEARAANSCWDVSMHPPGDRNSGQWYDRSISESAGNVIQVLTKGNLTDKPRTLSLELDKHLPNTGFSMTGSGRRNRQYTTKIMIIWLEDYEDHLHIPIDAILPVIIYTEELKPKAGQLLQQCQDWCKMVWDTILEQLRSDCIVQFAMQEFASNAKTCLKTLHIESVLNIITAKRLAYSNDLLGYTETGQVWRRSEVAVICVCALRGGLVRVRVAPHPDPAAPPLLAGPLVDGAVLAPHLLPDCLRQTALNIARRRRLHDDMYQPPHARRRHLIQEVAQQYKLNLSEPELLESLFRNTTAERSSEK